MLSLTRAMWSCGTAVPPLGQRCHQGHETSTAAPTWGRKVPEFTQKQVSLPALHFGSLVSLSSCRNGITGVPAYGVCLWASCPGIVLSVFGTTEAVCLHMPCANKFQKFTPIWVKKCVLSPILLLWSVVNTGSAFTFLPASGIL